MQRSIPDIFEEVRFNTNRDANRFTDPVLINYLNNAIRVVQRIIYLSLPTSDVFSKRKEYPIGSGVFNIPNDCYATNSINSIFVKRSVGNNSVSKLRKLSEVERGLERGYYIENNQIVLSMMSSYTVSDIFQLSYFARVPRITSVKDTIQLPDECEDFVLRYIEKRINMADSSSDEQASTAISDAEKADLTALFADTSSDYEVPPFTYNYVE